MDNNIYYFYDKKTRPSDYEVYFHSIGIVGYKKKQKNKHLYFKGTERDLLNYYKERKIPRVIHSKGTLVNY